MKYKELVKKMEALEMWPELKDLMESRQAYLWDITSLCISVIALIVSCIALVKATI